MPERWLREVRRLGDERPPDGLWDEVQAREGAHRPRHGMRSRVLAAAIALLVFAGAAYGVARAFLPNRRLSPIASITVPPPTTSTPAEFAIVVCDGASTKVSTPVVRNRADGVHVSLEISGKVHLVGVESPAGFGQFLGVDPGHADMVVDPSPPGTYRVVCLTSGKKAIAGFPPESSREATFTVVGIGPTPTARVDRAQLPGSVPGDSNAPLAGPLQGRILFTLWSLDNSDRDLTMINADGTGVHDLLTEPEQEFRAAWSPDGTQIVFIREGNGGLWAANADGTGVRHLIDDQMTDEAVTWSPDGSRIAFHGRAASEQWPSIWIADADGSGSTRITPESMVAYQPSWSPDGERIAFAGAPVDENCCDLDLYLVNSDGSGLTRLTNNGFWEGGPVWSPDGSKIAFMRASVEPGSHGPQTLGPQVGTTYAWDIYVVNADGTGEVRLTDWKGFDGELAWSPDGTMIAFGSDRDATTQDIADNLGNGAPVAGIAIYVMNADGGGVTRISGNDVQGQAFPDDWRP